MVWTKLLLPKLCIMKYIKYILAPKYRNYNNHNKGQFFNIDIKKNYEPVSVLSSFHCLLITMPSQRAMANTLTLGKLFSILCTFAMNLSISICLFLPRIDFNMPWKSIHSKRASFALCGKENMTISPADLHFGVSGHEASCLRELDQDEILLRSYARRYFSVPSGIKGEDKADSL